MDSKQEAFLRELLADFKIEAAEHHLNLINGLIALEQNPDARKQRELIEITFRELHSLKGAARAVNQLDIERLCQRAESVFHSLKEGKILLTPGILDVFHKVADTLQEILQPRGVGVVVEAQHLCMQMRGVQKQEAKVVTSAMLGAFRNSQSTREEFMNLIKSR